MTENQLEIGTVVQLKSGGPLMTVMHATPEGNVLCQWFDNAHSVQEATFKQAMLQSDDGSPIMGVF